MTSSISIRRELLRGRFVKLVLSFLAATTIILAAVAFAQRGAAQWAVPTATATAVGGILVIEVRLMRTQIIARLKKETTLARRSERAVQEELGNLQSRFAQYSSEIHANGLHVDGRISDLLKVSKSIQAALYDKNNSGAIDARVVDRELTYLLARIKAAEAESASD